MQITIELSEAAVAILEIRAELFGLNVELVASDVIVKSLAPPTDPPETQAGLRDTIDEARAKLAAIAAQYGLT
jgi:hypothetical protein